MPKLAAVLGFSFSDVGANLRLHKGVRHLRMSFEPHANLQHLDAGRAGQEHV